MKVQEKTSYNAAQLLLQDAYRVHKVTVDFGQGLYAAVSQIALIRIAKGALLRPDAWQDFCVGIDTLTGKPIAEMEVDLGPTRHSVTNILALLARLDFDWTPRPALYADMNVAITKLLLGKGPEDEAPTVHEVDTVVGVYNQIAMQMSNLIAEWLLVGDVSKADARALVTCNYAEAINTAFMSTIAAYLPEAVAGNLIHMARQVLEAWTVRHRDEAMKNPATISGVIPFNAVLIGTVFSDIEKAEEVALCSNDVQYNPEYKGMRQVDRDYIFFHRVLGRLPSEG